MKLIHLADLHLGASMRGLGDASYERAKALEDSFVRLVDIACDSADMLIIAGDLFDRHDPAEGLAGRVMASLKKARDRGLRIILVPGNHDEYTYPQSVYRKEGWRDCGVLVTNPAPGECFKDMVAGTDIFVASCAYVGGITKASHMKGLPRVPEGSIGILAMHATLDNVFPGSDEDRAMKVETEDIKAAGYSYAALGHIHARYEKRSGGLLTVYPGPVEPLGFSYIPDGTYACVEITGKTGVRVSWKALPGLERFADVYIDMTGKTGEEAVAEARNLAGNASFVRVTLSGSIHGSFHPEWLKESLRGGFKYVEVVSEAVSLDMEDIRRMAEERSLRGSFAKRMLARLDQGEDEKLVKYALAKGIEALEGGPKA